MIKSAREFVELRMSSKQEDYLRAAADTAPLEVWMEIIRTFPDMKVWVVRNKTVPIEILALLASDPDSSVRSAVAMKNKLPQELMSLLAGDADESVRQRIAYNKNVDAVTLEKLSRDQSEMVSSSARERLGT